MVGNGLITGNPIKDLAVDKKLMDWTMKTIDAFLIHNVHPAIGSVVYCNLAVVAEHTKYQQVFRIDLALLPFFVLLMGKASLLAISWWQNMR